MLVKTEDQGIATGSSANNNFSEVRARRHVEENRNESNNNNNNIKERIVEEIYELKQKAVVISEGIYESVKKTPKSTLFLLALMGFLSFYTTSFILSKIYFPATDLVCTTPYSDSVFSFCKSSIPNFSAMVKAQVEAQERLLKQSAELDSEGSLAHEIKKTELAAKDLISLISYSNLQSKEILVEKLKKFTEECFQANSDLQTLQIRAQTSLDNTLTYISFTLKTIEESSGKVISPRQARDLNKLHNTLMKLTDEDLRKLIYSTDNALKTLKKLDAMQSAIHDVTVNEEWLQKIGQEELLSELWSLLGGNRVEKALFESNLLLLKNLDTERKIAVEKLTRIMEYLEKFQKQLDVLREAAVIPLLVDIPIEIHLTNIKKALMRLQANEITNGVKYKSIDEKDYIIYL